MHCERSRGKVLPGRGADATKSRKPRFTLFQAIHLYEHGERSFLTGPHMPIWRYVRAELAALRPGNIPCRYVTCPFFTSWLLQFLSFSNLQTLPTEWFAHPPRGRSEELCMKPTNRLRRNRAGISLLRIKPRI